jgi:hypothetical protein
MIRDTICLFLFSLLGLACVDYGSHQDPECEGVVCNSPPADTCVDGLTKRVYKSPGTCKEGVCSYGFEDIECAEGECVDGVCEGCTPACGDRECGPDPRCGTSCGDCIGCYSEIDPSLCMEDGTCAMVCCPDCTGRECGGDGCGGICGSCDPGCSCNMNGQCECGCVYPNYPTDCSLVSDFQCGFDAYCDDGVLHVSWHEHVFCNGEEVDIIDFTCTYECSNGCEEGAYIDWPENGEQLVADNCLGGDACAGILVDNQGPLGIYPLIYDEPPEAAERYWDDLTVFFDTYLSGFDDYSVEAHPVTWTPDVNKTYNDGAWIPIYDIELSENNIEDAARGFLSRHAEFFKTAEAFIQVRNSNCSGSTCRVNFDQSYCGLEVATSVPYYNGNLTLIARQQDAGLQRVTSNLVPMIPVYTNPHVSQEEAAASLTGMTLEYWCADGPHYATVTEQSEFTFAADPVVFVQTAPTGMIALEYRLSHKATIAVESFLTWTAYIDAFDGTLLKIDPDFICD